MGTASDPWDSELLASTGRWRQRAREGACVRQALMGRAICRRLSCCYMRAAAVSQDAADWRWWWWWWLLILTSEGRVEVECVVKSSHWLACWLAALVGGCVTIPPASWRCEDKEHRNNDNDNTTGTYLFLLLLLQSALQTKATRCSYADVLMGYTRMALFLPAISGDVKILGASSCAAASSGGRQIVSSRVLLGCCWCERKTKIRRNTSGRGKASMKVAEKR